MFNIQYLFISNHEYICCAERFKVYTYFFHYPHYVLPVLIVDSSFVHVVRNFGSRIAAANNSGSPDMWPKRFFPPAGQVYLYSTFQQQALTQIAKVTHFEKDI